MNPGTFVERAPVPSFAGWYDCGVVTEPVPGGVIVPLVRDPPDACETYEEILYGLLCKESVVGSV